MLFVCLKFNRRSASPKGPRGFFTGSAEDIMKKITWLGCGLVASLLLTACNGSIVTEQQSGPDAGTGGQDPSGGPGCFILVGQPTGNVKLCLKVSRMSTAQWPDALRVDFCRTAADGSLIDPSDWAFRIVDQDDMIVQDQYSFHLEGMACSSTTFPPDVGVSFDGGLLAVYYRHEPTCSGWDFQATGICAPTFIQNLDIPPLK